jgi:YVTN family beta-propeller protein
MGSATVSVIDTARNTVVGPPVAVGSLPYGVAITPDSSRAYVANFGSGTVSVIDTARNTAVGWSIAVGSLPVGLAITPVHCPAPADGPTSAAGTGRNRGRQKRADQVVAGGGG